MISAELPLSARIHLVLNRSIMSMMTRGSSCDCFTPLASSFKKTIMESLKVNDFCDLVDWVVGLVDGLGTWVAIMIVIVIVIVLALGC